jgi:hypothetical protein
MRNQPTKILDIIPALMTASHLLPKASRGARMGEAMQISIALWLAIMCLALAAAQWLDFVF